MTPGDQGGDQLAVLRASSARLRALVEPLDAGQLGRLAYPSEWTIADVLSHLGSGAVIHGMRIDAALSGVELAPDFPLPIWEAWNAKPPVDKARDALVADEGLLDRLEELSAGERDRVRIRLGPFDLDLAGHNGLRVNEHVIHSWDIAVALDPAATLLAAGVPLVVDNLALITPFAGRHGEITRDVRVRTTDPERSFVVGLAPGTASLDTAEPRGDVDLTLPAEAFARLVYGRLDPHHTPPVESQDALDALRLAFRGI